MRTRHQPVTDMDQQLHDHATELGHLLRGSIDTAQRDALVWFLHLGPREQRLIVAAAGTQMETGTTLISHTYREVNP